MTDRPTTQRIKDATDATTRASKILEAMTVEELRQQLAATTTRLHEQQSAENKRRFDDADKIRKLQDGLAAERGLFTAAVKQAQAETKTWREQCLGYHAEVDRLTVALRGSWSLAEAVLLLLGGSLLTGALTWLCLDQGWTP